MCRLRWKEDTMKFVRIPLVALGLAAACSAALASEYGNVISATPVMAQVPVPQQQCYDQPQAVSGGSTGGGALVGALIGGLVGNNFGGGMGRVVATGVGAVAGAAIGDRTEAAMNPAQMGMVRNCATVTGYQNRVVGYDVVYDYNGRRYSTRTAQNPGRYIPVDVTVTPSGGPVRTVYTPAPAPVYDGGYRHGHRW
jgi:uncharacterized protein YcfJ